MQKQTAHNMGNSISKNVSLVLWFVCSTYVITLLHGIYLGGMTEGLQMLVSQLSSNGFVVGHVDWRMG